jgi:hypothetical protein
MHHDNTQMRMATKRQLVAYLLPLPADLKNRLEVLCLGLVGSQSEIFHKSFRDYMDQCAVDEPKPGTEPEGTMKMQLLLPPK